jgi:hypothetical protein
MGGLKLSPQRGWDVFRARQQTPASEQSATHHTPHTTHHTPHTTHHTPSFVIKLLIKSNLYVIKIFEFEDESTLTKKDLPCSPCPSSWL